MANLLGTYIFDPATIKKLNPANNMAMETVGVSAAQTAAFLLLNDNIQWSDTFPIVAAEADIPDGYSPMGTPVYGRIILGKDGADGTNGNLNTYTDAQGNKGSYRTVQLDCALVDIGYGKHIVKTDIQGLDQTIKEFISSGDNDITITGIYNSTPNVAPLDFIANLNMLFNAPVPIPVTNYYLNLNGIYYIVIEPGTRMGQVQGEYATQRFVIYACSDVPMTEMLP